MVVIACGTCQVQPFLSLQLDGVISGWRPLAKAVAATTGWLFGGRPIQRLLTGSAGLTFKALSHWQQAAYRYGESRATLVVWWANFAASRTPERRVWDGFLGSLTGEGGVQVVSFRGSHTGRLAACTSSQRLLHEVGGFFLCMFCFVQSRSGLSCWCYGVVVVRGNYRGRVVLEFVVAGCRKFRRTPEVQPSFGPLIGSV